MATEITQLNGKDLLTQLYTQQNPKIGYELAQKEGLTLSEYLEKLSPSKPGDKLDAYERLLMHCGIVLKSDPAHGIYASKGDLFFQSNMPESRVLFPEFIERTLRVQRIARADFLKYIVKDWQYSVNGIFRAPYFDQTEAQRKMGKKGAGTKNTVIKATWSEKQVIAEKFACELQMNYDFVRGADLPIIATALECVAQQQSLDELGLAISTLINGDDSTKEYAAAGNTNLSSLGVTDPSGTEDLTYKAYLKWLATFHPYKATTIVASMPDIVELICMAKPTADPALLYALIDKSLTGGVPEIVDNPFGQVAYVPSPDTDVLTDNTLLALDRTAALMGHRDIAMNLVETDRLIRGQFEVIVISNKLAFSKIFTAASKTLTTSA